MGSESTVSVYTTSAIQERVDRHLIGNAFLMFAVCAGGDYDTVSWLILWICILIDEVFCRRVCWGVAVRPLSVLLAA